MDTLIDIAIWFAIISLVLFVLFIILLVILAWRFKRIFDKMISSDPAILEGKLKKLQVKQPEAEKADLLQKIIREESRNAGIVGFLTGFGGLITLPVALPVDMIATLRIQNRLAEFIVTKQPDQFRNADLQRLKSYAIMFGAQQATEMSSRIIIKLISRYAPQVILRALPLLGGIVGFLMNYASTRGISKFIIK